MDSNRDSMALDGTRDRSAFDSTGEIFGATGEDDDLKYVADEAYLKKVTSLRPLLDLQ